MPFTRAQRAFLRMAQYLPTDKAARDATQKLAYATLWRWKKDPEFKAAYDEARELYSTLMYQEAERLAERKAALLAQAMERHGDLIDSDNEIVARQAVNDAYRLNGALVEKAEHSGEFKLVVEYGSDATDDPAP